jgi:hypothetical protein
MHARNQTKWISTEWRAEADAWIKTSLNNQNINIVGEIEQFHLRAWSTVMRVPTTAGDHYFKAGDPNQAFEPALGKILYRLQPRHSLSPLATDEARAWMLLPDGGQTLREQENNKISQKVWSTWLARFAQMQIELAPAIDEMLAAGVPDRRLANIPDFYDSLLADSDILLLGQEGGLSLNELDALKAKKTKLVDLCQELAAFGIPQSLDHGDLHDANIFFNNGKAIFFDWGDATISHPFITLMIPLRVLADKIDVEDESDPRLNWARDAYLQPWTKLAPMSHLLQAWNLALHIGKFQRAISWHAVSQSSSPKELGDSKFAFPGWLKEFLYHGQELPE